MGVEAAVLTDSLLHLQHPRAHVRTAGAQLELLLAPTGGAHGKSTMCTFVLIECSVARWMSFGTKDNFEVKKKKKFFDRYLSKDKPDPSAAPDEMILTTALLSVFTCGCRIECPMPHLWSDRPAGRTDTEEHPDCPQPAGSQSVQCQACRERTAF